jgi:cytochrome c-type biogenesis protein CcmF
VRKWELAGWLFNTIGIVLGMWWAYVELGWGGYWAWDPVENASLLPWLINTAFLHSIMVQEKRGMLRRWNVILVISAFLLAIFGTFITRSGIISSVHSFAQSPVGKWFAGFLILAIAVTAVLVGTRLRDLRAPAQLDSMLSREAAFLYNNVVLVAIAFSVLWGTLFPIISEAVRGEKITVGPPFFNAVNVPLGLTLLLLTGIGPLIAWRRASPANLQRQFAVPVATGVVTAVVCVTAGMRELSAIIAYSLAAFVFGTVVQEFVRGARARRRMYRESTLLALAHLVARNRRRYGGYVVHLGVLLLFAAFAGLAFKADHDVRLRTAESAVLRDPYGREWRFVSEGLSRFEALNRQVQAVTLAVYRDGERVGLLSSEKRQHVDSRGAPTFEPSTEVGILGSPRQDVYVVLAGVSEEDIAELRISFNPLVWWVWVGGFVMAIGGLIVMWPQSQRARIAGPAHAAADGEVVDRSAP